MAYYCGNGKGQTCRMRHKTLMACLQECNRLEGRFGNRFQPHDVVTHKPVEVVREEP